MQPPSNIKNPFISFDNVSLRLGGRIIFPGTNWKFFDDENWAIIGANGSGKSVLAKALSGQIPVVGGQIIYHYLKKQSPARGCDTDVSPKTTVSYVCFDQQKKALARRDRVYQARWHSSENTDALSVPDYLAEERVYNINPYQVDARRPDPAGFQADRDLIISTLAIQQLMKKRMIQLSNGEMRKVMLARAFITGPRLLILDNPFTGLDQDYRRRLKAILVELMDGRQRVIIVTSRQDEILPDISHVMVIENQKIMAAGPKEEVIGALAARNVPEYSSIEFDTGMIRKPESQSDYRTGDVLVNMQDANISCNGMPVLRNIDWTIKKGEHWALVGPNGSGKTTLLSLILGDNPQAYANDIILFGRRKGTGESIWETKQKIGFVSPELHLYFPRQISGFDAVCSGFFDSNGLFRRCSLEQRQTAMSWMGILGLLNYRDTQFDELSNGAQRLILIARAMVKQPLLLIMDEPCQGLDADNRHRVLSLADAIGNRLDATIIFVTHEINELPGIITHKLILNQHVV